MHVNGHSYALSVLLPTNDLHSHWMASNVYAGSHKENNLRPTREGTLVVQPLVQEL